MTLRPKSFFFTLALIFASQAFALTEEERVAKLRAGIDTAYAAAMPSVPERSTDDQPVVQSYSQMAAQLTHTNIITENGDGPHDGGAAATAFSQCPFMNESITPEFRQLMGDMCLPASGNVTGYCDCLRRLIQSSTDFKRSSELQGQNLQRIGYQFMLQQWSDKLAAQTLAFQALKVEGNTNAQPGAPIFPPSCEPTTVYRVLQTALNAPSNGTEPKCEATESSKRAFLDATRVVLGKKLSTNINFNEVILNSTMAARIYPYGEGDDATKAAGFNSFVDCMPPEDKRALSFLPVAYNRNVIMDGIGRKVTLTKMIEDLKQWRRKVAEGNLPRASFRALGTRDRVTSAMQIFPGIETLMDVQSSAEFKETIDRLLDFLKLLDSPKFMSMTDNSDPRKIKEVLDKISRTAGFVKNHVKQKLEASQRAEVKAENVIDDECKKLQEQLTAMVCTKPDFISSQGFMQGAFEYAVLRGTKTIPGNEVTPGYAQCDPIDMPPAQLGTCMTYHAAQCNAGSVERVKWSEIIDVSDSRDVLSDRFGSDMRNRFNADHEVRRNEQAAVQFMCGPFNRYLREEACRSETTRRGYANCIIRQPMNSPEYIAWKVRNNIEDPAGAALAEVPSIGDTSRPGLGGGFTNLVKKRLENLDDNVMNVENEKNAPVVSSTMTGGDPVREAFDSLAATGRQPAVTPRPTTILDTSRTPEEVRAAIEEREQKVTAKTAEIAAINDRIDDLAPGSESARLRSELEALRADMLAERERSTREIAELRNRSSNPETIARTDSGAEDDGAATSGRGLREGQVRPSFLGAGIPQVQSFNVPGGASRAPASVSGSSGEFERAKVDTSFATAGATRSAGLIQAAQALPQVTGAEGAERLSLRVGNASFPVSEVKSFVLPAGAELVEDDIIELLRGQVGQIPLDEDNRAFVEIRKGDSSSVVVYVRINGAEIEFLDANIRPNQPDEVRATLEKLESLLRNVVPQS